MALWVWCCWLLSDGCCCGLARHQLPRKHRTHPRKRLLRRRLLRQPRHRPRFPRPNRGPQNLVHLLLLWRRGPLPPLFPQTGELSGGWLRIPTGDRPKPPTWWLRSVTNTQTWTRRFSIRREEAGVYLVTVGGAMDRDAALKMRSKAQREGLPADTYVQNFSR